MSKRSASLTLPLLATGALLAASNVLLAAGAGAGAPGIYGKAALADNGSAHIVLASTPLPTTPGANPLSVGHMQTFVFKAPAAVPELSFNDPTGKPTNLAAFKGKVVLVNLWATWCIPCRKELPDLDKLQAELGSDKFEVIAISLDRSSPDKPRKLLDDLKLKSLKLFHDPSARLGFAFKAPGMPATFLIDREGREVGRLVGPADWASEDAKRLIKAALAAGS